MKIRHYILGLLSFATMGCAQDIEQADNNTAEPLTRAGQVGQVFYYYGYENRKIFLNQVKGQVLVKFAPTATKEQFRSVVNDNASLRSKEPIKEEYFVEGYSSNTVILEGKEMSSEDLNSLKAKEEIASATYLLEYHGSLSGITDEFIVKLREGTSLAQLQELSGKYNCRIGEEDEFVKDQYMLYVQKTSEMDAMQAANLFYETGLFEFAEPNLIDFNAENSYDQFFPYQWGLKNTGQSGGTAGVDINVEPAWAITKGSANVRIAVIDSGIDLTHPDLQGNLLAGYDATGYGTGGAPYSSQDNHGTAVAGIIGALQNNLVGGSYEGISGVAPNCKIVPVKASINGSYASSHASNAINWVVNNGISRAEVINCSWGAEGTPQTNIRNAINNALTNGRGGKGCIVVAASGNNAPFATVDYPANISGVIAVGAVGRTGVRAIWGSQQSNYGMELDVVAPGTGIYTTDRQGSNGYTSNNYISTIDGTSFAAPHVSGIAALLLSAYPNFTRGQVENAIIRSASSYPSRTNDRGYGLVNALKALFGTVTMTLSNVGGTSYPVITTCSNSTATLSIPNGAPNYTITWRGTPGIQIVSGQGTKTLTFRKKVGSTELNSALYADIYVNGTKLMELSSMRLDSAPEALTSISVMGGGSTVGGMVFSLIADPQDPLSNALWSYEWRSSDPDNAVLYYSSQNGGIGKYEEYLHCSKPGIYYIECRPKTSCGSGQWVGIEINAY